MFWKYSLLFLLSIIITTWGSVQFTKEPPKAVHVFKGDTARLVWEYHVDDRNREFDINSPKWNFYTNQGVVMNIASEDMFQNWKWIIHRNTCPPRLLNPTRVFKEALATLVIKNITTADSGTYGCRLVLLRTSLPITSKVMLSVLEHEGTTNRHSTSSPPAFPVSKENTTDLPINFTKPRKTSMPPINGNVTHIWENTTELKQSALSSFNETPIINKSLSDNIVKAWMNKSLVLRCIVNIPARQNITWYSPTGNDLTNASHSTKKGSHLSVIILRHSDYGIYTCRAENIFGFDEHKVNVTNSCLCPRIMNRQKAAKQKRSGHKKSNPELNYKKLLTVCIGIIGVSWVLNVFLVLKSRTITKHQTRFSPHADNSGQVK